MTMGGDHPYLSSTHITHEHSKTADPRLFYSPSFPLDDRRASPVSETVKKVKLFIFKGKIVEKNILWFRLRSESVGRFLCPAPDGSLDPYRKTTVS
jgi:hypothetical protein